MTHSSRVAAGLAFLILLSAPLSVGAQYRSYDRDYWRNSDEGSSDNEETERVTSRRGISSSIQKKINNLDDDEVEDLPIPILLAVSLSQLTKNFGDARDGGDRSHEGLDILAPRAAYVVSPTEAVVIRTGKGSSAGTYVYTANPGGETFIYMHLDDIADGIKAGTELEPGDLIGYVGDTGNAKGGVTHLHFEIRDGRKATDPYPRLTEEFTLKQRIEAIGNILEDADDEEEEAEFLVQNYRGLFLLAQAEKIKLPKAITEAMEDAGVAPIGATSFLRDLTLNSTGNDVISLQALLIAKDSGPAAKALAKAGATGFFGPITQQALAEYQAKAGITPASGYFGPLTRAYFLVNAGS